MVDQSDTHKITVNGTEFNYVERGSGEPVILIHGSLGDYRTWEPQLDAFSQEHRTISYSRRYHFPNPWTGSGTDYTAGLHAEDLIGLIETLGLAPVSLVGNSFGAYTALVAAIRRPDLMRKLVIGEPPILPWVKDVPGGQAYWDDFMQKAWEPATQAFRNGDMERGVQLFVDGVSGAIVFEHIPAPARQRMMDNARSLQAETASPEYYKAIAPEQVEGISVPMLLLKGELSPKMFHVVVDRLAPCVRDGQQATIPNASHSMPSGNPPVYNRVVLDFLKGS